MYLSDGDLDKATENGSLIFDPKPEKIDPTSIDLDSVESAKMWDINKFSQKTGEAGSSRPELRIGQYDLAKFSKDYLTVPPDYDVDADDQKVQKRGNQIVVRNGGFLLWQTKEEVGTPSENAELICFVDGKSTRARAGILVHLTAPTIHSSWSGRITLEIANLGPFDLILQEDDVIAQLTVANISSPPTRKMADTSKTYQQSSVDGTKS